MKGLVIFLACIAVVVLMALAAFKTGGESHTVLINPNLKIDDIRGDTLGMGEIEYTKKHPFQCGLFKDDCVGSDTYAGIAATKDAQFTANGKLWKITYLVQPFLSDELLRALKEKYGDTVCTSMKERTSCNWANGKASILFVSVHNGATVDFTDDRLKDQWLAEYQAERAAQRKKDQ
ncbi:MAG TPA: hypothetical protein VJW20_20335 [Candidatus Angelobacter sp.]|nr:hypothetical protein [Candidatus Angelobacter sp.]